MNRMNNWLFFVFCVVLFGFHLAAGAAQLPDRKPNIVLILADDVGIDAFSDYIGTEYTTPNIDRMGELGIRFENCYSQPLCTPSRVKIMTGQYNFRNYTHFEYMNPADKTFGNVMQEAGYKTAIAGKWQLNGSQNKLPGYDDPLRPHKAGFDEFMLWQVTERGNRYWQPVISFNGKVIPQQELEGKYGPDLMSDFVCDFIRRHKEDPFFVYYPTVLPHSPFKRTPDSVKEKVISRKADPEGWERQQKQYFVDMVAYLDKIVGKIIRTVEESGVAEETIILFTADNGTNSQIKSIVKNSGGTLSVKGGKGDTPELGTHVPFYVLWDGTVKPGSVSDTMIDFTDFYATFADLAGVDISNETFADGVSFAPVLRGEKAERRDWMQCTYTPYFGNKTVNRRFVRDREYKLYADGRFYHIPSDLLEEKPVVEKNAAHQRLQKLMDQFPKLNRSPEAHQQSATRRDIFPDWQMGQDAGETKAVRHPPPVTRQSPPGTPNIVLIMGDDIGFSDIGCYGSEIETPNIDSMARNGMRFQQFYNMAKCSPTRSTLLTGLYGGYEHVLPVSRLLSVHGYQTGMFGKNHLAETFKDKTSFGKHFFDRSLTFWCCTKFFFEKGEESPFYLDGKNIPIADMEVSRKPFYKTDVFTDYGLRFMEDAVEQGKPFFLYMPYHTAHFPIQAREEDIAKYRGRYKEGWDVLRTRRFEKMKREGVVPSNCKLSPPESLAHHGKGGWNSKTDDPEKRGNVWRYRPWDSLRTDEQDDMDLEMAVYAAMIDRMDQNVGRILAKLKELGCYENTMVIYLSDNGACAQDYNANFDYPPGHPKSYRSMSVPWSNLSNTPFRQYKWFGLGGGCNTHCIVQWPGHIEPGTITSEPGHVVDWAPTFVEMAGVNWPANFRKKPISRLHGQSLLPVLEGGKREGDSVFISGMPSFRMYREGNWKITKVNNGDWMLFDLSNDWTELNDLAGSNPEVLDRLQHNFEQMEDQTKLYNVWEARRAKNK